MQRKVVQVCFVSLEQAEQLCDGFSKLGAGDDRRAIDVPTDNLIATSNYIHFCIMIVA